MASLTGNVVSTTSGPDLPGGSGRVPRQVPLDLVGGDDRERSNLRGLQLAGPNDPIDGPPANAESCRQLLDPVRQPCWRCCIRLRGHLRALLSKRREARASTRPGPPDNWGRGDAAGRAELPERKSEVGRVGLRNVGGPRPPADGRSRPNWGRESSRSGPQRLGGERRRQLAGERRLGPAEGSPGDRTLDARRLRPHVEGRLAGPGSNDRSGTSWHPSAG